MKKKYISPLIEIETFEPETEFMQFSKAKPEAIGEGDEVIDKVTVDLEGSNTGEGLNAKQGFTFGWSNDLDEWDD